MIGPSCPVPPTRSGESDAGHAQVAQPAVDVHGIDGAGGAIDVVRRQGLACQGVEHVTELLSFVAEVIEEDPITAS
jgi:hypothetical protein